MPPNTATPASICLLRLSALGDVTHVVPLVRTLQRAWPHTRLSWVIGALERRLLGDLVGVEFITYDKRSGLRGLAGVRRQLSGHRFDALLQLQVALRANLLSTQVRAARRIGYDDARARDGHGLFVRERIPARSGQHVVDAIGSFAEPLGLRQDEVRWDIPIPEDARAFAREHLPGTQPVLLLSPCASKPLRNWRPQRYAALADHAIAAHGYRVVLCGGRSEAERRMGDAILGSMENAALDLIGKDTLKQLLALMERADLVVTPDSGPMHMANAVGTKVLGLHAASNPDRSGPYSDRRFCVNRYDDAARRFRGKPAAELPWGTKLEYPDVMDLVTVEDAVEAFERFVAWRRQQAS